MTQRKSPHHTPRPVRAVPILSEGTGEGEARDPLDQSLDDAEELQEAEREIGINEWLDAETGEPAEGQSPPHLEQE